MMISVSEREPWNVPANHIAEIVHFQQTRGMEKPQVKHDIMQTQDNFKWMDALLLEKSNKPLSKKKNFSSQIFEN